MHSERSRGLKPRLGKRALLRARPVAEPALQRRGTMGFTLVEVLLALSLGSLVVLFAHRLFTGVADGARRLAEARQALDRESNARRWLAEAFGSLEVGGTSGSFVGQEHLVQFGGWQLTAAGWPARTRVSLAAVGGALVARIAGRDPIVLADSVRTVTFDYLLDPGANTAWVKEWISPVSAPLSVRMRIARAAGIVDTLLLILGPRG